VIEIRGQRSTDWRDVYAMRIATAGALPYIRPTGCERSWANPRSARGPWWPSHSLTAGRQS
jgi:hypothetical protein